MHDPETLIWGNDWLEIWHKDPCRDGTDDSCGRFKRARHGSEDTLKRIVKRFEFDWDRTFTSDSSNKVYACGFFLPNGRPHLSVLSIGINLFWMAAYEHFHKGNHESARRKTEAWMQRNIADIIMFVENPFDSLADSLTLKFGCEADGRDARFVERYRKERIHNIAACIYGWIIRKEQHWWQHPRWHVHHWRLSSRRLRRLFTQPAPMPKAATSTNT